MKENKGNKSEEEWLLQLVEQKSDIMYRLVYNMLNHSADTEDVVSTAILKAWENRKKLYQCDKAGSWLIRVAMNEASNIYRTRKKLNITDSIPEQEIDENQDNIWDAVRKLKTKESKVVILYYYEGYSVKEIASILKIPIGTVKSRLSSARNHLKQYWRDEI